MQNTHVVPALALFLSACAATGQDPVELGAAHGIALDHYPGGTPALVFLHGWCCDRGNWRDTVPAFSERHEVIALDLAGHGESTAVHEPWTVTGLADEVVAVLEGTDTERAILVGHSMGGWVALASAAAAPERVIGVIGVDTLQDADYVFPAEQAEEIVAGYEADFEGTMNDMVEQMFAAEGNERAKEIVLATAMRTPREPAIALMRAFPSLDMRALFAGAGVPIRCINSGAGWVQTDIEGNRELCDYDAVVMDSVSHWPMLDRPEEFNTHLARWVAELDAAAR
jgi:pimeloyl-ACP methyl ester carboxylesterase